MSAEMFHQAVEAAKAGQRKRAKDLLTRLLKTEPNNVDYWVWMSAAVETEKEQIFCLQKAVKADPNSIAARRGLVILGAMTPEEAALPPPQALDNLPVELPQLSEGGGLSDFLSRPRNRQLVIFGGVGLVALILIGAMATVILRAAFRPVAVVVVTSTPTPSLTAPPSETPAPGSKTATPTLEPCSLPYTPDIATPIAAYLCLTPVPISVLIPTEASQFESYNSMKRGYADGDWDKVIRNADQTINLLPENARVYFYLAEAYRHKNQINDALKNYRQAIAKDSNFAAAYWGKALIEFERGNQNEGLSDLNAAVEADASFPLPYIDRAAYFGTAVGNYGRALADLQQAQQSAPENALVLAHLAVAYAEENQPDPALETAQQALALDPGLALAYYARGRAEYMLGQHEAADKDLTLSHRYLTDPARFAQLFPVLNSLNFNKYYTARVLYFYGLAKAGIGDDDAALKQFNQALDLYAALPSAQVARGNVYLRLKQYDRAREDFNAAIGKFQESDADNPALNEAYLGNGLALLGLNRPDSALSNFQVVVRNTPDNFTAQLGLGQAQLGAAQLGTGNVSAADAAATFGVALTLAASDEQKAQVYYWRAQALQAVGDVRGQIADLALLAALADAPDQLDATAAAQLTALGPLPTDTLTPTVTSPATNTSAPSRTPTPGRATATATVSRGAATATASQSRTATPPPVSPTPTATLPPPLPATATTKPGYPAATSAP